MTDFSDDSPGYDSGTFGAIDPSYLAYLYGNNYSGSPDSAGVDNTVYEEAPMAAPQVAAPIAPQEEEGSFSDFSPSSNSSLFPALPGDYYASYYNQYAVNPAPENSSDYSQMYEPRQPYDIVDSEALSAHNVYPNESASPAFGGFGSHPNSGPSASY